MAKYDQNPDFAGAFPGLGTINAGVSNSQGSEGIGFNPENIAPLGTVPISHIYDSNTGAAAPPMVAVDAGDASLPSQVATYAGTEKISGVELGGTGAGSGHVIGDHHPGGH